MALNDLTSREAVERAMDEFDEIGRRPFLAKYHFGGSRLYLVMRNGKPYDSKAIAGAAFGFQHPDLGPLTSKEFSGGEQGAKAKLEELGFEVISTEAGGSSEAIPLREALERALLAQQQRPGGEWSTDLQKAVAITLPDSIRAIVGDNFRVKGSAGFGRQAEIPWVSVMPWALKGASEGRYVVYLLSADGQRLTDVIGACPDVSRRLIGSDDDIKTFVKTVVATRNYHTHYDSSLEQKAAEGADLYRLTVQLRGIIEMSLLRELDFPCDAIDGTLERVQRYAEIRTVRPVFPEVEESPDSPG